MVPLPYKNNKMSRVCQTCYNTLSETTDDVTDLKPMGKRRSLRQSQKKISLPSVLREVSLNGFCGFKFSLLEFLLELIFTVYEIFICWRCENLMELIIHAVDLSFDAA